MIAEYRLHRLKRLAKAEPEKRFDRLFREITKVDFLMYAYEQIKDNKGAGTPGIDGKTKANWNIREAESTAAALSEGIYTPSPVRRVYIPKKSGKFRALGIPTFADRVVQSAMKLILEVLYEPMFLHCSHGFRPSRGCYTALNAIYDTPMVRIDWVVEGDIKACFDNVSHQILIRLLQRRIKDDRFLKLISKFLKAGYFEREIWNPTKLGTPQGGIISPVLANIYLHEMDRYIEERFRANQTKPQTDTEMRARLNPEYKRLDSRITRIRAVLCGKLNSPQDKDSLRNTLRQLIAKRKAVQHLLLPIKPRITYTRYADDFVIALRNLPRSEAESIREDLTKWLRDTLNLVLSPEKTAITHISDGFVFLGYKFLPMENRPNRVKLVIPYESAKAKMETIREICSRNHKPEVEIIRSINNVLRGWMSYYSCATSPSKDFRRVLSSMFWTYGDYVAKKHDIYFGQAAKRWITRCPSTPYNPRGGQKTWKATGTDKYGRIRTEYLICSTPPKRKLQDAAYDTYRKGQVTSKLEE